MTLSEVYLEYMEGTESIFNDIEALANYHTTIMEHYLDNIRASHEKVIKESGTSDDLIYLEAEAKAEVVKKKENIIVRMFHAFNQWVRTVFAKVRDWFNDKQIQRNLNTISKVVDGNPEIKNKKIEIPDVKGMVSVCNKYYDKSNAYDAKIRSGILGDPKSINLLNEEYNKEFEVASRAVITVTVATALTILRWACTSKDANVIEQSGDDYYKNINAFTNPDQMTALSNAATNVSKLRFSIQKDKGNSVITGVNKIVEKIKSAITGKNIVDISKIELPGKKINPLAESATENTLTDEYKANYVNNVLSSIYSDYTEAVKLDLEYTKDAENDSRINEILDSLDM